MGVEHQNVISFDPATVLPTLVENAGAGITAAMVAARDAAIQTIQDANEIKRKRKEARRARVKPNCLRNKCSEHPPVAVRVAGLRESAENAEHRARD